ncbi:hypothetical protein DSOL_5425 [Desulfosporosinus metallidurans]|uniref:Uncharacterized protein n=1 Tax=Desulfosporosinus metallidurans TaxID=1888891 RepID=A0A1Q8QB67_9FIRM|nr:hypothetical protein DSOL_5425 [Desulfosporosinus metallidurans]
MQGEIEVAAGCGRSSQQQKQQGQNETHGTSTRRGLMV